MIYSRRMGLEDFKEEEFSACIREFESKNVDGWELFTEYHGVQIFRLYDNETGLYQYKIYGGLDVLAETCAQVYMDIEYRKKWDSFVADLHVVEKDGEEKQVVYWQAAFPWPMSNRDYVYRRQYRKAEIDGRTYYVVLAREHVTANVPERSGVVRVDKYIQSCAMTDDGKGGSRAFMHYFDNPGGYIPKWLINWAAKTGVPTFLTSMEKSCKEYDSYLASKAGGAAASDAQS